MREAFEAWVFESTSALPLTRIVARGQSWDGHYAVPIVQSMWLAWQAATAAERERCAKTCDEIAADRDNPANIETAWRCAAAIRGDAA